MRLFSIITAFLSFASGIGCIAVISKLQAMYEDFNATLPNITRTMLNTSGWFPGGIFFALALLIPLLLFAKKLKSAAILATLTILLLVLSVVVLPAIMLNPLSMTIHDYEANQEHKKIVP